MRRADADINSYVDEINAEWFIANEGGRAFVIKERWDRALRRYVLDRSSASDFRLLYGNQFVWEERETKTRVVNVRTPLGKFWLEHIDRRQYKEIVFDPDPNVKDDPEVYNLWRGWNIEPEQGDWSLWRDHLFEIGAAGDEATYTFLLDWFAYMFQRPHVPAETAIVWRGRQGAGKGLIARAIGRIVGQHFIHVHNVRHLVGNFNSHLRDGLFVFSDEALWAGDKAAEGILKAMISEPTLMLEPKGRDTFSVPNRVHLAMATNNDWGAPVGVDDRRFCIVDVPDTRIDDRVYFRGLIQHLNDGALAAFLYDMLRRPVSDTPQPPRSAAALSAALTQKLYTMPPAWQWWYEKIESGVTLHDGEGWLREVEKKDLHADYLRFADQVNITRRASETILGMSLREFIPGLREGRGISAKTGRRERLWKIPDLDECRKHFGKALKIPDLFNELSADA